ncbi:MAG: lysylphosphatidylglycerol synthase transmembrane domain-containing protein [Chloroflexota bacterium]
MSRKKQLMLIVGIIISLVFLILAFDGLDWQAFFDSLSQINAAWLPAAGLLHFVVLGFIGLREQILLRPQRLVPLWPLFEIHTITAMGNNVYPLSGGEAVRVYMLKRKYDIPIPASTTNVIIARAIDGLVLLACVLVAAALVDAPSPEIVNAALVIAPLFVGVMVLFSAITLYPGLLARAVALICRVLPEQYHPTLIHIAEQIVLTLSVLRQPQAIFGLLATTFAMRMVEAGVFWLVLQAFDFPLGFSAAVLTMGVVNLAGAISASPGQIGVNQFAISIVLTTIGLTQDRALAYAIVVHMTIFVPVTVVGFILLAREGMGLRSFAHAQQTQEFEIRRTIAHVKRRTQEMKVHTPQQEVSPIQSGDIESLKS